MTELRKCSRCRSVIELKYFGINRKGEPFKTCETCRNKRAEYVTAWNCEIKCDHCGDRTTKSCKSIHKKKFWCQTSKMNPRPSFEEWLAEQDYDKLLWEYKQLLTDDKLLKEYAQLVKRVLDKMKPAQMLD